MGNTPSHPHGSPAQRPPHGGSAAAGAANGTEASPQSRTRNSPNLRLPMPQRSAHVSPQSSNPTSPSGRPGSPRRRKSLELPDLNKLSFTPANQFSPAAPLPTTATSNIHHQTTAGHGKRASTSTLPPTAPSNATSAKKWHQALGGHRASPLANPNALSAMSRLDSTVPGPKTAPPTMTNAEPTAQNPYFPPTQPIPITSPRVQTVQMPSSPLKSAPMGIPAHDLKPPPKPIAPLSPPPPYIEPEQAEARDGLVNVPIHWLGGGRVVYVAGNFADNWKGRIKLTRGAHDFHTTLRLPPGQYRLKFIVDESWICANEIPTASDNDGTLVNWLEVEAPKTEEELKAEWAMDAKPNDSWTSIIPPPLTFYQYLEEYSLHFPETEIPVPPTIGPQPPSLPRILEKVILNAEPKRVEVDRDMGWGSAPPAGLDDNSILAVPNHVVLNHLTASAIKNGTLGVGTTTRYRKKYITTMFFKPTPGDMFQNEDEAAAEARRLGR
ncbi:5'-AMP-activated protein kinase, regulatory beta subunit, partial [Tremellales sp. Uapishka_1]